MRTYTLTPEQARQMPPLDKERLFDWVRTFGVDPEDVTGVRLVPTKREVVFSVMVRDDKRRPLSSPYDPNQPWVENETHPLKDRPPLLDYYSIEVHP